MGAFHNGLLPAPNRCVVMGVLNVTPDSFSDGGHYLAVDKAVAHGLKLHEQGADVVDVGGESTRPGAERVPAEVELSRVVPVIRELAAADIAVSVDTTRAEVAAAAIQAGAIMINDVSGGLADPRMSSVAAESGVPWILMHWRGPSKHMSGLAQYADVVAEVRAELTARVDAALAAGVSEAALIVDPGLGFAKTENHNWELLQRLEVLLELGFPVLIGASRKRFLRNLLVTYPSLSAKASHSDTATAAISALAAAAGAWGVRVHDVPGSLAAVAVAKAWHSYGKEGLYG